MLTHVLTALTIFTSLTYISRRFYLSKLSSGVRKCNGRCDVNERSSEYSHHHHQGGVWNKGKLPPGPRGLPIIGNLHQFLLTSKKQHEIINEWANEFGDVFTFRIFSTRFVILSSLPVIRKTFQNADINDMATIPPCNKALGIHPDKGVGIIAASEGPEWKDLRRFLISILRKMKLGPNSFEKFAAEEAKRLLDNFHSKNDEFFDPMNAVNIAVANITTRLTMGKRYSYNDKEFLRLTQLADDTFEYFGTGAIFSLVPELSYLPSAGSKRGDESVAEMFDFIRQSVVDHRKHFDPNAEPNDMVECFLLEQHERRLKGDIGVFDDINLLQFTWDILIGGWQTTNTTILWYLFILAQHQVVQHQVQEELDRVIGRDRLPGLRDKGSLPYVLATMAECYRLSGLLPIQIPHRTRCDVTVGRYGVPQGSYVASNTHFLCSSSTLWDEPEEFRPERFLDEDGEFDQKREAGLVEFGAGRRACPGEQLSRTELFILFSHVFHRFVIELDDDVPRTMDGTTGLTVNPLPFKIRATQRR
nr:cytochrome P450 2F2-like [Lytechinus pictus]